MRALVTGISGFIGGRLASRLVSEGHEVRGLSRAPEQVRQAVPVVRGDAAAGTGLDEALADADVAYYLIHSLESGNDEGFVARDRRAARNFAEAARRAGVGRIIYFGVPSPNDPARASEHIRSRQEVEGILLELVPASVALRSWFVLSAGSPSFRFTLELLRQPAVLLPPWRDTRTRPTDVRDVIDGLVVAADSEAAAGESLDLMGPDTVSLDDLMRRLAAAMGVEPEFMVVDEDAPADAVRFMAEHLGGDPELILPIALSLRCGDILPQADAAPVLNLKMRSLDDAIAYTVSELLADECAPKDAA